MKNDDLKSSRKSAIVTGASRGIGEAIAERLAKEGYDLTLVCSETISELKKVSKRLEKEYGIRCTPIRADVSDSKAAAQVFEADPEPDILINNAGISYIGLLQDMTDEEWRRVIDVNLTGAFYMCRNAISPMLRRGSGSIINISSVWGEKGASMEVAYSASKGGLNAFTKALARELAPSGIPVNAVSCGVIDTKMNEMFSAEELDAIREEIPEGRMGRAEEVAELVWRVLQSPSYMTGQIITLDGGWT
ncbi:MAG: SDR family oxidoreductase [Lachnospiraceae bacterium]|nr:SDR family oxidoreductase [Lachnospiraceae bacterium]